eukprot:sb/3469012/
MATWSKLVLRQPGPVLSPQWWRDVSYCHVYCQREHLRFTGQEEKQPGRKLEPTPPPYAVWRHRPDLCDLSAISNQTGSGVKNNQNSLSGHVTGYQPIRDQYFLIRYMLQVANIQYAEPNNMSRSTATITNDDMYYCQPDESLMNQTVPETPVPGYASQPETPVYAQPDPETPLPEYGDDPETPVPVYHNAEVGFTFAEYQDPATKFSHVSQNIVSFHFIFDFIFSLEGESNFLTKGQGGYF